jgi:2-iminobutanoate/2-iminopropanoate deaminase
MIVSTNQAPVAVGPYSQAVVAGGFIFCSGAIPLNPTTGQLTGVTAAEQTEQALKNLATVLEAGGSNLGQVVKTTVYLHTLEDFQEINQVYAAFFPENPPARTTVEIARLPKDALVEIDAIAIIT